MNREACVARDHRDPLGALRSRFAIPDGVIYLDGNSLGPPTVATAGRMHGFVVDEWGQHLVGGWNDDGWIDLGRRLGARIAPLVGASPDEVIVCDSTSVNLFKLLHAALDLRPGRRGVLAADDEFPTDAYLVHAVAAQRGRELRRMAPERMRDADLGDVAVVVCSHVHYRTARVHDLPGITAAARRAGALVLWDLSHSVGARDISLAAAGVDLAVGCTYKFLSGGPGAPAFAYVRRDLQDEVRQPITGWLGHRTPFAFAPEYEPAPGVERLVTGTPAVAAHVALDAALDVFDGVALDQCRDKAEALTELFIELVEATLPGRFGVVSPRDAAVRGAHVALTHEHGRAIVRALALRDVVADFRPPDVLRFGFAPLYVGFADVHDAVGVLADVMAQEPWTEALPEPSGPVS